MAISKERLKEIEAIKDEDIDTAEIPELDERFWKNAKLILPKSETSLSSRNKKDDLE